MYRQFYHNFLSIRSLFSLLVRKHATKPKIMENVAYFRYIDGETSFHVTFQFTNASLQIRKQFNFCRQVTENTASFLNRVDANLNKTVEKKQKNKKIKSAEVAGEKIESNLLRDDLPVDSNFLCAEIFRNCSKYALSIAGQKIPIEINAPWVEALTLPKGVMSGFLVYPSKFEAYFTNIESSEWTWSHSEKRGGPWTNISSSMHYETTTADIGKFLRLCCKPGDDHGRMGPEFEGITQDPVAAGPGPLPCEDRQKFTANKIDETGLRVVSYNILADLYVDSEYSRTVLFGYCPTYALDLNYRRQLLLKELLGYNADIMCLQEVDAKVFKYDLSPILKNKNLIGDFCQKGTVGEGTAIFYDINKFKAVRNWREQLSQAFDSNPLFQDLKEQIAGNEPFLTRIMDRSTTLQILLLESQSQLNEMILVANIHLYFHPDADHVRLFQSILCIKYLENLQAQLENEFPQRKISLIWCGDFNSVPECGIYALLTTGSVSDDNIDWNSNPEEAPSGIRHSHNMQLASACGTPQYTNYTLGFKACLDYIFYNPNRFLVEQAVPFPSNEELSLHGAIPSIVFPSDHIALIADLKWK